MDSFDKLLAIVAVGMFLMIAVMAAADAASDIWGKEPCPKVGEVAP